MCIRDSFSGFVEQVSDLVLAKQPADPAALNELALPSGESVEVSNKALIAKIGENIQVRRFVAKNTSGNNLGQYSHSGRIGVVCELEGGDAELAKEIAMHIAASNPICVSSAEVPAEVLEKEKAILMAEAGESGKPQEIIEKMVEGRIRKYLAEITLVGQPFVKDPEQTVEKMLASKGAKVLGFTRYEVGEGIEKKEENFADEVAAQVAEAKS